ncbi:MAG: hypothetical protein P5675_19935 [Limnospira sp. PMC 917.15]|nr:hypothetical protein [Limnospira sp. PMC 917.15]
MSGYRAVGVWVIRVERSRLVKITIAPTPVDSAISTQNLPRRRSRREYGDPVGCSDWLWVLVQWLPYRFFVNG